jgi:2-polyprenyl-6-methoxyphenol hydroxylase-like FAD-dependent oxidoreductase
MSTNNAFEVIVVGGGPVGLTAAHAFSRAGIPFTLLERRESAIIDAGSNLVLSQIGMRALAQLDLLDHLDKVTSELKTIQRIDHSGRDMGNVDYFKRDREQ